MVQKNSQQTTKPTPDERELQKIEQDFVSKQLRLSGLSLLTFFFMAMGIFMAVAGCAAMIWVSNPDLVPSLALRSDAAKHASELEVSTLNILNDSGGFAKIVINEKKVANAIKTEARKQITSFGATIDKKAEKIVTKIIVDIANFFLVSGLIIAIFFGLCWRRFEHRRIIHAIDNHPREVTQ